MADNIKDYKAPTWKVGDKLFAKDLNNLAETVAEVEELAYKNKDAVEELQGKEYLTKADLPEGIEEAVALKGRVDALSGQITTEEGARLDLERVTTDTSNPESLISRIAKNEESIATLQAGGEGGDDSKLTALETRVSNIENGSLDTRYPLRLDEFDHMRDDVWGVGGEGGLKDRVSAIEAALPTPTGAGDRIACLSDLRPLADMSDNNARLIGSYDPDKDGTSSMLERIRELEKMLETLQTAIEELKDYHD